MAEEPSPRAVRLNRWIAGTMAVMFIASRASARDYWGVAFGTLVAVWISLRLVQNQPAWARTARRIVGVVFFIVAIAAIWLTLQA